MNIAGCGIIARLVVCEQGLKDENEAFFLSQLREIIGFFQKKNSRAISLNPYFIRCYVLESKGSGDVRCSGMLIAHNKEGSFLK